MSNNDFTQRIAIDQIFPSCVFLEGLDGKITACPCWMLSCVTEGGDFEEEDYDTSETLAEDHFNSKDFFVIPLLPTSAERQSFLKRHNDLYCYTDGIDHAICFDVSETKLGQFLKDMPEFDRKTPLQDIFAEIKNHVGNIWPAREYKDEEYGHKFYLAKYKKDDMLLVEFEDNCYRPTIYLATKNPLDGKIHYVGFCPEELNWRKATAASVEVLFRNVSEVEINALNEGLENYHQIEQNAIESAKASAAKGYHIMDRLNQIMIVPVIWRYADGMIELCEDILGNWKSDQNGNAYLNLREFQFVHRIGKGDEGEINLRDAHKAIS